MSLIISKLTFECIFIIFLTSQKNTTISKIYKIGLETKSFKKVF